MRAQSLIHVRLLSLASPWTIAHQDYSPTTAQLSMECSRQEYWSALPFPPPGDLLNPGIEPASPASLALADGFFTTQPPGKPSNTLQHSSKTILLKHKSGHLTPVFWTLHRLPVSLKETQSLHSPQAAGGLTPPDPVPCPSHTCSACSSNTQSLPEPLHMLLLLSMTFFP